MAAEQWPSPASEALKFASVANLKLGLRPELCPPQPLNHQLAIERKIQFLVFLLPLTMPGFRLWR
jgi:hypothetical protein